MRLFQNSGLYPAYVRRLSRLTQNRISFASQLDAFLGDRYGACHFLKPVLDRESSAFFTNGDDEQLQRRWAQEQGMRSKVSLAGILRAQIESHKTEVFYNLDPMRYQSDFVRSLPGCVKKAITWRAAPSPGADFSAYDLVVCNFPGILEGYRQRGWNAAYFSPAHDPEMDAYAANTDRPIDVLFVGGYSRHHRQRAVTIEAVASMRERLNVVFCLDRSRLTRLAESALGYLLPLGTHRRPSSIRAVSHEPVFGRELYAMISQAKIVLNGAVDMAGRDRGNMRCFEAMGCGALMVSDQGVYPEAMVGGLSMLTYTGPDEAVSVISHALSDQVRRAEVATVGWSSVRQHYSKQKQWQSFEKLVGAA